MSTACVFKVWLVGWVRESDGDKWQGLNLETFRHFVFIGRGGVAPLNPPGLAALEEIYEVCTRTSSLHHVCERAVFAIVSSEARPGGLGGFGGSAPPSPNRSEVVISWGCRLPHQPAS